MGADQDREDLLQALAAARRERDDLLAQMDRLNERHNMLAELNRWALGTEDPLTLVGPMLDVCTQEIGVTGAGVYLVSDSGVIELAASTAPPAQHMPPSLNVDALNAAARNGSLERKISEPVLAYEYIVPISERGTLVGAVVVRREPSRPLEPDDVRFLYGVATAFATAIAVWAADLELRRLAMHDPLTGLPNRLFLLEHLSRAIARSLRAGASVAVFFIDFDDFKSVNDSWGHHAGDELLVEAARRLAAAVRAGDLMARLAGDEFIAVVESVDDATVAAVMSRLQGVFDAPFIVGDSTVRIRASIGVTLGGPGLTPHAMLALADDAMYAAKAGRKR